MPEMDKSVVQKIEAYAAELKESILRTIHRAGEGHVCLALSLADIVSVLYCHVLRKDVDNLEWPQRDRVLLSKGHGCVVLYAAMAKAGYFPAEWLDSFLKMDTNLPGHPDLRRTPGVEMSTGSLGQGLSVGMGIALAGRLDGLDYRTFVLLGDGECNEGMIWEAAMAAAHHKVDTLVAIIDRNHFQCDGFSKDVMDLEPFVDKWRSFGWSTLEIDGHNIEEILQALSTLPHEKGKPTAIVANTVKGKGVSFMENRVEWHYRAPNDEELELALAELAKSREMQQWKF